MTAKILDGRAVAQEIQAETSKEVAAFEREFGTTPTLALVRAGDDPASVSYARMIKRTATKRGIEFQAHTRPADASEQEMVELVRELSADRSIHAVIIQKPMPEGMRSSVIVEALSPAKDVDGAHPLNAGRLAQAVFVDRPQDIGPYLVPATPLGMTRCLISSPRTAIPSSSSFRSPTWRCISRMAACAASL